MDIVEFLRARLDEDEGVALGDIDQEDRALIKAENPSTLYDQREFEKLVITKGRVLREVEAKRQIIEAEDAAEFCEKAAVGQVLYIIAAVYADHPDYQENWQPGNYEW